jgi:hypothetical protein
MKPMMNSPLSSKQEPIARYKQRRSKTLPISKHPCQGREPAPMQVETAGESLRCFELTAGQWLGSFRQPVGGPQWRRRDSILSRVFGSAREEQPGSRGAFHTMIELAASVLRARVVADQVWTFDSDQNSCPGRKRNPAPAVSEVFSSGSSARCWWCIPRPSRLRILTRRLAPHTAIAHSAS